MSLDDLNLLPITLQAQIATLRHAGVSDPMLAALIDAMLAASEAKTTSLQMDIARIEESISRRLDRLGDKLQADVRTQHGVTNEMLLELRMTQMEAQAGIVAIKKSWDNLDSWRGQVDQWRSSLDNRMEEMSGAVADHDTRLGLLEHRVTTVEMTVSALQTESGALAAAIESLKSLRES